MITPYDIVSVWGLPVKESPLDGFIRPEDKNWSMIDLMSMEIEAADFLWGLTRYFKPNIVVETGTYYGFSAASIALALAQNNRGHIWSIDIDEHRINQANKKIQHCEDLLGFKLQEKITFIAGDSLSNKIIEQLPGNCIDLLVVDGGNRLAEQEYYSKYLSPNSIILQHDALKKEEVYSLVKSKSGKIIYAGRGIGWV